MGNIEYSTRALNSLFDDSRNTGHNVFGFRNNFGVRAMGALEIDLVSRVVKRTYSEEYDDSQFSKQMDKLGVYNFAYKQFKDAEWRCYLFNKYFDELDIDVNLGVNQTAISEYCVELQNNSLDFFKNILENSNMLQWEEKPLYFSAIILLFRKKFKQVFDFEFKDFKFPFDDIYSYHKTG